MASSERFWENKQLDEMSREEWESLCDGCGKCCLKKLEDIDTNEVHYTDVACRLLDHDSCRCTRYPDRHRLVPDCIEVTPDVARRYKWLPESCAYRLLAEGKALQPWHPLISGDPASVHRAGISVHGRACSEDNVPDEDLEDHIVGWPEGPPE